MKHFISLVILVLQIISLNAQVKKEVLFIGNSYTYSNNLPELIKNIALSNGDTLYYDTNTPGGYTFELHSTNTVTLSKINKKRWDYVIFQEQSQRPSFSAEEVEVLVYPYAEILTDSVTSNDTCSRSMFFMTWGRENGDSQYCPVYPWVCTYDGMQERLRESYLEMGALFNAEVAPVGAVWSRVRNINPEINLYSADGSHPNIYGSYLSACVFYSSLFHKSSVGSFKPEQISEQDALILQQHSEDVVMNIDSLLVWNIDTISTKAEFSYQININQIHFFDFSYNALEFFWDFGDGNTSEEQNPIHTYAENGNFDVMLKVRNNCLTDSVVHSVSFFSDINLKQKKCINIYPNPALNYFFIYSEYETKYSITDCRGNILKKGQLLKGKNQINISSFNSGVFFLRLINNISSTHKIIHK